VLFYKTLVLKDSVWGVGNDLVHQLLCLCGPLRKRRSRSRCNHGYNGSDRMHHPCRIIRIVRKIQIRLFALSGRNLGFVGIRRHINTRRWWECRRRRRGIV